MARLIYLMGPSGAGKDSLLAALRADADSAPLVAHRYITRPADAGCENHIALSEPEFLRRRAKGLFALDWQAHQQHYAFGIEVDLWLLQGIDVAVNGSRAHLPQAQQRLWCAAAAGVSAGQRRDPAPAPAGSRARKRRTDRAAAGAGGGISAESARRLPGAAQRWPTRRHPGGAAGAAAYRHPTSSGRDAMNDFAQPKIGDNVTLNRTRLGQYVHLADDAILEEVEMGTTPTPPGTTRSLRHYRQVRLHCFLCAHQSQQPPDLPAHRAAPLHLSRFRIRAGEDDAAFFDWRREHHVTVGHDVWIGHNAILMPGVSVGNGAVIGSAAVVTRTWSLTASSPAWRPKDRHAL